MTEHLGHEKYHAPAGGSSGNIRNGTRAKTVLTDAAGQVDIQVPRDRAGRWKRSGTVRTHAARTDKPGMNWVDVSAGHGLGVTNRHHPDQGSFGL